MSADSMTAVALLATAFALPWAAAAALAVPRLRPAVTALAPLAALPALLLALTGPVGAAVEIPWLLKHTVLLLDATGRIFLGFTSVLYMAAAWYARSYLRDDPVRLRFFILLLLAMAGNLGLILAGDIPTFFTCFAIMGLASAGLVSHRLDAETRRASRIYLALTMIGEVLILTAFAFLVVTNGTTEIAQLHRATPHELAMLLVLVGFGIKAGALTLHFWLPLAHPAAPVPASAVLSGTMIKAGLLGWIRFLPLGHSAEGLLGFTLITAGLGAALLGAAAGIVQHNAKTVLAYSSVCQMGILMTGLGIGAVHPAAWPGVLAAVLIYTTHHALAKGALFLGVGPVAGARSRPEILTARLGMLIPALALAGAPLTSGALAKTALKSNLGFLPDDWAWALGLLLPLAAVGTTAMMIRLLVLVWPPADDAGNHETTGLWAPWLSLVAAVVVGVWLLPGTSEWLPVKLSPAKLWLATWPLLAGGALAVLGARVRARFSTDPSRFIPPGDVGVLAGRLLTRLLDTRGPAAPAKEGHEYCDGPSDETVGRRPGWRNVARTLTAAEAALADWPVIGAILLASLGALLLLLVR